MGNARDSTFEAKASCVERTPRGSSRQHSIQAACAILRWWPGLDAEIEQYVGVCPDCVEQRRDPYQATLYRWEYPSTLWQRLHVDYAGPLFGFYRLMWVNGHTKYAGVHLVHNPDSKSTIKVQRSLFAHFGLPDQIVTDNGTPFVSDEFSEFLRDNGIRHLRSSPHHPQNNGEAERFVGTFT